MKWSRSIAVILVGFSAVAARAELGRWIQDIPSPSALQAAFFRAMTLPGGPVEVRRPPRETREELTKLINASPSQADLYSLRAREDEMQLDFAAAENDWKKYVQLSPDKLVANIALADFCERQIRSNEEVAALHAAGEQPTPPSQKLKPAAQQQPWQAFLRIQAVIQAQALPPAMAISEYRAWIARYPAEPEVYKLFVASLVAEKQFAEAQRAIDDYRRAFPKDDVFPVQASAELAAKQGSRVDAARIYDQNFRPLWPQALIDSYFETLKQTHNLRTFQAQAVSRMEAQSGDIAPVARLFYYHQQQKNEGAAQRVLLEYRRRKTSFTPEELWTLGHLFEDVRNYDEAARSYYGLYKLGAARDQERALAAIARLLLDAPDQNIRIGGGDLSMYRDIATMDPGPGFLNGVLSLILNSTGPRFQYDTENQASTAYFHRVKAAELIAGFDQRYPNSAERPELHAKLINAYVVYGDSDGVIRAGQQFLRVFPKSGSRVSVAIAMADAYARQGKLNEEFAIYDRLLKELGAEAENAPLGEGAASPAETGKPGSPARSPEYARVLDRTVARLVAIKRIPVVLALYRQEIDRNPNDPGLYERLAGFLDQNKLGNDVEQVYRKAMAQFQDRSWSHKLARFYLRRKQTAQFDMLTRDVVKIFSGTELEAYIRDANTGQALAPVLYRQVNLYAHQRFPNDLMFVRNLLSAYANKATPDPAAREALLRRYWYYSPDLRDQFFEQLSRTGKLRTELAAIQKPDAKTNPAAARFVAEAEAWQSHFEAAAPLFRASAAEYPGDVDQQSRAAALFRSTSNEDLAATIEQNVTKYSPRDTGALATVGEMYAGREQFARARPYWDRIAAIQPGKPEGYLEAATVYWDYFRFDDALRLIGEGRQKLGDARLFSYQSGAIYENQRDYSRAIQEYAKGALGSPEDGQSRSRLVELARRPGQRAQIDDLTAKAASGPNATTSAVSLRLAILVAQNRPDDIRQLLLATASNTSSLEVAQWADETAGTRGLDKVQEQAKLREIALTSDPVERLTSQVALVHFYESHQDAAAAARTVDDLYKNHPTVLGVVRTAVEYYWRNKDPKRAINVLTQAAAKAQPEYRDPFTLEAARKATETGDTGRARTLLATLIKSDPFRQEYVAAMADTYARQGDDKGLRDFYNERLKVVQQSSLAAGEKIERAAAIRRGLIPVLTRMKDYAGAVDQYIEILNRYPDDPSLAQEAAVYAASHAQQQRLVAYYQNTEKQSPRDFRWPLIEARVDVFLEDFPAAVAAYRKAAEIRPDRTEFYTERASLEMRLLRFEDAAATYTKLYELTYHNSAWMERLAEVRARQGKSEEAVKALNAAFIEGNPRKPEVYFSRAQRLESWNMLPQAKEQADKGVSLAGATLLTDYAQGAATYLRVMTRLRQYDAGYQKLASLVDKGKALDPPLLQAMGSAVSQYFTPEEKVAFGAFIGNRLEAFLPAIQSAGLLDLQAKALAKSPQELQPLQERRLRFGELGAQLEAYWKSLAPETDNRDSYLDMAANAYRMSGDAAGELRVLALKDRQGNLAGPNLERYAELLARTPARLKTVASSDPSEEVRNAMANYFLQTGNEARSFEVIGARGQGLPPVWTKAYTALSGLFFLSSAPQVAADFQSALGLATIGERLGKPVDRNQQLSGDIWFYYGSRYGEYLGALKQTEAEDYLPAELESRPGSAQAYFNLGEYYRQAGQPDRALEHYREVLQLDSRRIAAHDRVASLLIEKSQRNAAIAEFRAALNTASRIQDERHVPNSFWTDVSATLADIGKARLLPVLRDDAERLLRTYLKRNGTYKADELMEGAVAAAGDPQAGVRWVIDLSRAAPTPAVFLANVVNSDWVPEDQRPVIYRALLDMARGPGSENEVNRYQIDFATFLANHKGGQEALRILAEIPKPARQDRIYEIVPIEIRAAAQANSLTALLNRYASDPETSSRLEVILNAANDLKKSGSDAASHQVREFVYTRQIDARVSSASTFLGLAEIRLDENRASEAVALLRRMTLVAGEPFDNLMDAANLLLQKGHAAEAAPFLEQRTKAVPWDDNARAVLAKIQSSSDTLKSIALSNDAAYDARVTAARALRDLKASPLEGTSAELILLSSPAIPPAAAEKPYFFYARLDAAVQTTDVPTKIRLLDSAVGINPGAEKAKLDLIRIALETKRYRTAQMAGNNFVFTEMPDLERGMAQAYESTGDLERALQLYRTLGSERDIRRVRAAIDLKTENDARRPVVSVNLEQDHPVRPRLTAANRGLR